MLDTTARRCVQLPPLCGLYFREGDPLEVDHIVPKYLGGSDAYFNLQLLHCHGRKTAADYQ